MAYQTYQFGDRMVSAEEMIRLKKEGVKPVIAKKAEKKVEKKTEVKTSK